MTYGLEGWYGCYSVAQIKRATSLPRKTRCWSRGVTKSKKHPSVISDGTLRLVGDLIEERQSCGGEGQPEQPTTILKTSNYMRDHHHEKL
ncbi:unnamed protein product [Knipowitschia caucasica]|uniref:Uncharacterized protein n=1 Tax=Knipowitschia caucasica TaxID=637954 RepID=A0AAV2LJ70_KNICA